ncbi:MAG: BMP family ABC transporter substrate-binding protein [Termitinemataceae bacterium]|nr:MAG: BMP family ABC transporter substrate-binding protein [Termitinemataceae bacterium]
MRKNVMVVVAVLFAAIGAAMLTSCAKQKKSEGLSVAIITNTGVDDNGFNQDCYAGILAFKEENSDTKVTPIKDPIIANAMQSVLDVIADNDVLILPGFQYSAVGTIAKDNPDHKIILVDTSAVDNDGNLVELPNIYSMQFKEEQAGFFAGLAAALYTKTNKVAVVNGMAFPPNVNFQFGFYSGVNYANKAFGTKAQYIELPSYAGTDVRGENVGGNYTNDFNDIAAGKVVGDALIKAGVDVIFAAAGNAGNGVFTAAKEANGVYLIGVDVDQWDSGMKGSESLMITSALKIMHTNVTKQLRAIKDGTFKGENALLGAESDSVGFVSTKDRTLLNDEQIEKMNTAYEAVKAGTIIPASNFSDFTPTNFPGL